MGKHTLKCHHSFIVEQKRKIKSCRTYSRSFPFCVSFLSGRAREGKGPIPRLTGIVRIQPSACHVDGLGPSLVQFRALYLGNMRGKCRPVRAVHVLQFGVVLPDINRKTSGNSCPKGSGFGHRGSVHGQLADVGLVLFDCWLAGIIVMPD